MDGSSGQIVAAVLTFDPNPSRQPPDRGVIEEQRLYQGLEQVDDVVVTAHMSQFVSEDRFDVLRCNASKKVCGNDHKALECPHNHGRFDHVADQQLYMAANVQTFCRVL
nr:hypothetical protein [Roseimaritima ulvae]